MKMKCQHKWKQKSNHAGSEIEIEFKWSYGKSRWRGNVATAPLNSLHVQSEEPREGGPIDIQEESGGDEKDDVPETAMLAK